MTHFEKKILPPYYVKPNLTSLTGSAILQAFHLEFQKKIFLFFRPTTNKIYSTGTSHIWYLKKAENWRWLEMHIVKLKN
jgi:hypothetical protein